MSIPTPVALAAAWYAGCSLAAYAAFWLDKRRARAGRWRIRERTLLTLALLGGFPGAYLAGARLRHKTRDRPFSLQLHAATLAHLLIAALVLARLAS